MPGLCVLDGCTHTPQTIAPTTGDRQDVLDIQILGCASAGDFEILKPVSGGQNGFIFKAVCKRSGLSHPDKPYALKVVYNFGVATNAMRNSFENEFRVLSQLPPHQHATRFWAQFTDEVPDEVLPHLPEFTREQARYGGLSLPLCALPGAHCDMRCASPDTRTIEAWCGGGSASFLWWTTTRRPSRRSSTRCVRPATHASRQRMS